MHRGEERVKQGQEDGDRVQNKQREKDRFLLVHLARTMKG